MTGLHRLATNAPMYRTARTRARPPPDGAFAPQSATQQEVQALRRGNVELKQLVAELSLEGYHLKKNGHPDASRRHRYQRMSAVEKAEVLARVASSSVPKREVLSELGVPRREVQNSTEISHYN